MCLGLNMCACSPLTGALPARAGDETYRDWGWNMFRAFEMYSRMPSGGYITMNNVMQVRGAVLHLSSRLAAPLRASAAGQLGLAGATVCDVHSVAVAYQLAALP